MNEDLQQHLMEFVYGLLDEDEANALRERITSDPLLARAYAKVKLQCDLVGRAARYEGPSLAWIRPEEIEASGVGLRTASADWSASTYRRLANWCIGVAATGLICLMGSSWLLSSRSSRSESTLFALAAAKPVQVVVTGPPKLHAEVSNPFTIQVESRTETPVSTTLNYRVYDVQGDIRSQGSMSTDQWGVARFDVTAAVAHDASQLEITTADDSPTPILLELEAAPEQFVTYLQLDRPLYQPGDRLYYRAVTLSRFGLRSDREVTTSFEIVDASDHLLEGSANSVKTNHGVASDWLDVPDDLPAGTYTLIARSPDNLFREEWQKFQVRDYETPQLLKKLELAQDSYTAGDQVDVEFSAKRVAGEPVAGRSLLIRATIDELSLATPESKTDADGNARFSLSLPDSIDRGNASLSVTVQEEDNRAETITKEIPINLGKVNVDFYPEGGELAAGLPSRVYFYGRDPLGKPTHIEGRIVDSNGDGVTDVVTEHEGRGVFSLMPAAQERYRLILEKPVGVTKEIPLPATAADCIVTIETGAGVFSTNAPIAFTLHQRNPVKPLLVAAYCRGAMVGQQTIEPDDYTVDHPNFRTYGGTLTLPAEAQGVIRLTVFDATPTPPEPIAERLVYRRVGQKLNIQFAPDANSYAPGQDVEVALTIRDENDAPVPAALGIAVVDDAVLNLADDKSMRMPTYFHLLTEIDAPEQLEDANFYLSDTPESVAALDSLLGTQGWRRFRHLPATQLAQANRDRIGRRSQRGLSSRTSDASWHYPSLAAVDETAFPLSTAKTISLATATSPISRAFAVPMIIASTVLLVLVGIASLRWAPGNRSLRVFAGVVAAVSLLVGAVSLPTRPSRVARAAKDNAPAAGALAVAMDKQQPMIADDQIDTITAQAGAARVEDSMPEDGNAGGVPSFTDTPMPAEAAKSEFFFQQRKEAPKPATRFAQPERQLRQDADAEGAEEETAEKAPGLLLGKNEKKALSPSPAPRPFAESAAMPEKTQPAAKALSGQATMPADQPQSIANDVDSEILSREYADWFYDYRSNVPPTEKGSGTLAWYPLNVATEEGVSEFFFPMPKRRSRIRAIVEAHGGGRLGVGELVIESREP